MTTPTDVLVERVRAWVTSEDAEKALDLLAARVWELERRVEEQRQVAAGYILFPKVLGYEDWDEALQGFDRQVSGRVAALPEKGTA